MPAKGAMASQAILQVVVRISPTPNVMRPKTTSKLFFWRGFPNKGGQNQNWLPHPCSLRGPKEGGSAT